LDSETIVAVATLFCIFLVIAFFQFIKPQFFTMLNHLAKIEFRDAKNQKQKVENIASKDTGPWPWYKAWTTTLFHPLASTSKVLLSEGRISFRQTLIWFIVVSVLTEALNSVIPLIKNPDTLTAKNIFNLVLNCLLSGMISPVGAIIFTAGIHILAKLFGSKGTWHNFFVVWVTFNAPMLILFYIFVFVYQVFSIKESLILGPIISFYWLFVVNPMAIKSNYSFRWVGSFLLNFFVTAVFFVGFIGLFMTLNPGLFKQ
jgi:hypothetical protein